MAGLVSQQRQALGDRSRLTAAGIPCYKADCGEPMDLGAVKTLMSVAQKELPDARATHGFMRDGAYVEEPVQPLSADEWARLKRFMEEAHIDRSHQALCPHSECPSHAHDLILDVDPTDTPARMACCYCGKGLCRSCKRKWHGGQTCAQVEAASG